MVHKYIKRDFTDHVFTSEYLSDEDEYIKFEVFSFDPKYTQAYSPEKNTLSGENSVKTRFESYVVLQSKDKVNPLEFTVNYNVREAGEYRIDLLYMKTGHMFSDEKNKVYNTSRDLTGWYDIYKADEHSEHKAKVISKSTSTVNVPSVVQKALDEATKYIDTKFDSKPVDGVSLKFDGEDDALKRKTLFKSLSEGDYKFEFAVPSNCYVMGVLVRKQIKFWGTNNDEIGSNLQFTHAKFTNSEMLKASELEVTVGYDDSFECESNQSGFYISYMDECNLYVKNNEGNKVRIFGGYVSTPLQDNDRRKITIHCADRLRDGENKYILNQLTLQKGDGSSTDYNDFDKISFDKHAEILRYLCRLYECTLKDNIDSKYHVDGETYSNTFDITFGKKKKIKKVKATNGQVTMNKNSVTLRNNSSGQKKQVFTLYNPKNPVNISKYESVSDGVPLGLNLHLTFGLGNVKTTTKIKETATVDVGNTVAGAQKFGKCGVSQDKRYVMAIGTVSSAKDSGHYGTYYKTVFKNKCPHCGEDSLVWDSCRSDTKCVHTGGWNGSKARWGVPANETEITCNSCDSDFSALGNEKDSPWKKLTKVGNTVKSNKKEQDKLHNGEMVAVPDGSEAPTADDIFKAIKNACRGWTHSLGTGSTASYLEKHGTGDCWAWSDWISKQLKKYKVNHMIKEYSTSQADNHRSVLYQNEKGKYVDFPYREYDFPKNSRNTSASLDGHTYYHYKSGGRINQGTTSGKTTKQQTTEVTVTNGYDKDVPFKAYLDIIVSFDKKTKHHVYVDFTQKSTSDYAISGLKPVWVNNASKKITLKGFGERVKDYFNKPNGTIYLHSISFITPKIKTTNEDKNTNWYTVDKSTQDNSSCKMILYSIAFNSESGTEPKDLDCLGKNINDIMKTVVEEAGYIVEMEYGEHRCDDKIYFRVNNNNSASFTATEGDNNNILDWGNISFNPANELFNMSRCVFKKNNTNKYYYVSTKDLESILQFQEQCSLITENDGIGEKEAYWNATHNEKFNPVQTYSYTITVKGFPDVDLKDLVNVISNIKKLNTLKEVESIVLEYDYKNKPVLQTELGLDELAPDLQVIQNIKKLRDNAKESTTSFNGSASAVNDENIYEWEF